MQMNALVRLFSSTRLLISSRPTLPSYPLNSGIKTSAYLSDSAASETALPEKPKRPVNAYIRFVQIVRSSLQKENPKASPAQISKLAAVKWQVLDSASKSKLEDEFKKDQAVWLQKNAKYFGQLTDQQKQDIRQARVDKSEDKAKREHRKRVKELGRPKRPLNGFLIFCGEQKPKSVTKEDNKSQIKSMADKWGKLSEQDKEPYNRKAADLLVKYREDIKKWEDKMIAEDNLDVVRRKHILIPQKKESTKSSPRQ